MPNVMVALPNTGGALCSTPQFGWRPLLECRAVTLPRCETCWNLHGCHKLTKRSQMGTCGGSDVNETRAYETETRHSVFGPRRDRDQDLPAIPRDRDETSDICHLTRPRPCKAETETFFETFNLQHCAKTMANLPLLMSQTAQLLQLQLQCSLSWNLFTT